MDGVKIIELPQNIDDRGSLYEVIHKYDLPDVAEQSGYTHHEKFGQVYVVTDPVRGTIRGLHRHKQLWDYFHIIHGSAKFVLVAGAGSEELEAHTVILSDKRPQLLVVPPKIFHGWMSLEDDTIMVSIASDVYNKEHPDEERVDYNKFYETFGNLWVVKPK